MSRLSNSAYCDLKRRVDVTRDIHNANNSLQKAGETMQINEITQNQSMKGGKPKLESHETMRLLKGRSIVGMSCQEHTERKTE